jgi:hypothetical protein
MLNLGAKNQEGTLKTTSLGQPWKAAVSSNSSMAVSLSLNAEGLGVGSAVLGRGVRT